MTRKKALCFFSPTLPASVKKAKHFKPLSLFLLLLAAMLFSAHAAQAQCYSFANSSNSSSLTLNITNLPTPTTSSDGSGGTNYNYNLTSLTGNTATVVYGSLNATVTTTFSTFTLFVEANPSFTTVQVTVGSSSPTVSATVTLQNGSTDILPSGWPTTIPALSNWGAAKGLSGNFGSTGFFSGTLTAITASCTSSVPPRKTLGDCGCNGTGSGSDTHTGQPSGGDPITLGTGNLFEKATDYTTTGPNPLSFTRYYNSFAFSGGTYATELGANWRSTYDRYLHISPATGTATSVIAERPDGQGLTFTWNGSAWVTDSDVDYKLSQSGSTWTLTDHNDTVETYSASSGKGTLSTIALRNGYTQTLTYSSGILQSVSDSYSRSFSFTYSSGLLSKVTTPDSSSTGITFGYTSGNLTSVTYPTSTATTLTYVYGNSSFPNALTGIIDENSNRYATWTYDTQARATSSKLGDTLGADLTSITYNSGGTVTVTNGLGVADTYTFSTLQGVPKVTGISRAATSTTAAATRSFGYDSNGFTNSVTDWNGNTTTYTNNSHGDPTTIVEASGSSVARTTTIAYDTTWVHLPDTITTTGVTTSFAYDTSGNVHTKTETDTTSGSTPYSTNGTARTWTNAYTSTGQLTSVTGPRTDVTQQTQFGYTGGTLTSITDALGHVTNITAYTNGGLPTTIVDPNSVTTTLTYDGRQRKLTSAVTTAGSQTYSGTVLTTTWTYDNAGNLTKTNLPDNSYIQTTYDNAHRPTKVTNANGEYISYTLDALGDRTAINTYTSGSTLKRQHSATFDALGRKLTDIGGVSGQTTTYAYDANGNATSIIDRRSHTQTQYFDALNRLYKVTDRISGNTTTSYDAHDRVISVQDPNSHTTSYTRDGLGRVIQITSPDSGTTINYFDLADDLTKKTDGASIVTNHTYDKLNRELTRTFPGNSAENVSKTYDQSGTISGFNYGFGIGRLTSRTDQGGTLQTQYDERGLDRHDTQVSSGHQLDIYYWVDAAGRVAVYTNPDQYSIVYGRDAAGQISSIGTTPPGTWTFGSPTSVIASITHLPFGPVSGFSYANGITRTTTYDADYRITLLKDQGTSAVQNLTYGYDLNDNVTGITDAVLAANSQTMTYDNIDEVLTAVSGTGGYGSYTWTYDANHNRTKEINPSGTVNYTSYTGTNRMDTLSDSNSTNFAYNGAGSQTLKYYGGYLDLTDAFDQSERLYTPTPTGYGSPSAYNKYDADGGMRTKSASSFFNYARSSRSGLLISEFNTLNYETDYIYLNPDASSGSEAWPVALVGTYSGTGGMVTGTFYIHADRLGTPQYITDSTKALQWKATYQPFGYVQSIATGVGFLQHLGLPGMYMEDETNYYYNNQRHYDPQHGAYIQSDPIGLDAGTTNTYVYASNNPFRFTDPTGLTAGDPLKDPEEQYPCAEGCMTRPSGPGGFTDAAPVNQTQGDFICSTSETWGNPNSLARHFADHGPDFDAQSQDDYAQQASTFLQQSQEQGFPTLVDPQGNVRVYDPNTNTFGSYNPNGTTQTFFKPNPDIHGFPTNRDYWTSQRGTPPWKP